MDELAFKARIDELKRLVRIEDLLTERGFELKAKGRGKLFTRCPLGTHEDKEPSFCVYVGEGRAHCYSCGQTVDVIALVQRLEGLSFTPSLEWLEGRAGKASAGVVASTATATATVEAPKELDRAKIDEIFGEAETLELLGLVLGHWGKTLYRTTPGRRYLETRRLGDPDLIKIFKVGYCDGSLPRILSASQKEVLQAIGVLNARGNSSFYRAITIPILGEHGLPVGFYGRRVQGRGHLGLVGGHRGVFHREAWYREETLVLVEGPIDGLSFYAAGVRNVSSLYGTSGWTREHDRALREGTVRRIVLALDGDEAGVEASERLGRDLREKGVVVEKVEWPEGIKDANELLTKSANGGAELKCVVAKALEVAIAAAEETPAMVESPASGSPSTPPTPDGEDAAEEPPAAEGRDSPSASASPSAARRIEIKGNEAIFALDGVRYRVYGVDRVQPPSSVRVRIDADRADKSHTDKVELVAARSRTTFARGAARTLLVNPDAVEGDLKLIRREIEAHAAAVRAAEKEGKDLKPMSEPERQEAMAYLADPRLLDKIAADIERLGYVGEESNKRLVYLVATSRNLEWPLAAIVKGPSSAGKSQLMEIVASMMPKEDVLYFSRISPQALYYMEGDALKHRLLVIDERDGSADADYSIRTLLSRRSLSLAVVMKDAQGTSRTVIFEKDGPISYLESTTVEDLNPENENRALVVYVDSSQAQTNKILAAQKKAHAVGGSLSPSERRAILARHHNLQRLLVGGNVEIPFADKIRFPSGEVRARRDNKRFLSLIDAIAFLHQKRRTVRTDAEGRPWIVATVEDYRIAYELAGEVLAGGLDELAPPFAMAYRRMEAAIDQVAERERVGVRSVSFTLGDVMAWTSLRPTSARRLVAKLVEHELVEAVSGGQGKRSRYRLTERKPLSGNLDGLTKPEDLE